MSEQNLWDRPKKITGITHPKTSHRFPELYSEALSILAQREKQRLGSTVSPATIIMNLTTRDSNFFRTKRTELREIYEQLIKEKQRAKHTDQENPRPSS